MVTAVRGHRCVFAPCSSHWVGCFGGGGRQWERFPEVNEEMLHEEKKKKEQMLDNKLFSSFSISLGGRKLKCFFLSSDWIRRGEKDDGR